MGIRLYQEPPLENPVLVASWPGIGNIGVIAVDSLRDTLGAEEFGELEPYDFFYPKRALIRDRVLECLEFPGSKLHFARTAAEDVILFIGEEQPTEGGRLYAEGRKAYHMANLVLDVADRFRCRRIYTSGAAVALTHHTAESRVWAVPNSAALIREVSAYENTVLMTDIEGRSGQGQITGMNGLLLGAARRRGVDAICLMGEIPVYLQGLPLSYPRASRSVVRVLSRALNVEAGLEKLDEMDRRVQQNIEEFYRQIPGEIRMQLDRLKHTEHDEPSEAGPITEEEEQRIVEGVQRFLKKEGGGA